MTNVISLISSKGGAGKTTIALNLSVALSERGHSTLLVDLDPLGAVGLALDRGDTEWSGLAEVLMKKASFDDALIKTKIKTLSILPRGRLDPVNVCNYEKALNSTEHVKEIIKWGSKNFEYIILDTPSGLGMISRAVLLVSNYVIIPLQAEHLSLRSISQVLRVLNHVKEKENHKLKLLGILMTMVHVGQESSLNVLHKAWTGLGGILDTIIPRADAFAKASEKGLPVAFLSKKRLPEARRFDLLAEEIHTIIASDTKKTGESDEKVPREFI